MVAADVLAGAWLLEGEREALRRQDVFRGKPTAVDDAMVLSPRTVASHAANISGKLGLASLTAVVAFAIRNGIA